MNFQKNVLILKQTAQGYSVNSKPISGIFRLEQESGVHTLFLTTINVCPAPSGEYALYFCDGQKKLHRFSLGNYPTAFNTVLSFTPETERGFSVGLCYESEGVPLLFAYSESGNPSADLTELKRMISARAYKTKKDEQQKPEPVTPKITEPEEFTKDCDFGYDDEAVATENYYAIDEDINKKLKLLEKKDERFQPENGVRDNASEKDESQEQKDVVGFATENGADFSQKYSEFNPYYEHAKKELEELFDKFPKDLALTKLFPDSTFVRINYSSNKYYVVGVIKEDKKEKYICYGVPSPYSEQEPEALQGFCSFIPLSIFEMKGDGYFMMFQDAVTGECIKKNQ